MFGDSSGTGLLRTLSTVAFLVWVVVSFILPLPILGFRFGFLGLFISEALPLTAYLLVSAFLILIGSIGYKLSNTYFSLCDNIEKVVHNTHKLEHILEKVIAIDNREHKKSVKEALEPRYI
jgi:hypothetical protein